MRSLEEDRVFERALAEYDGPSEVKWAKVLPAPHSASHVAFSDDVAHGQGFLARARVAARRRRRRRRRWH